MKDTSFKKIAWFGSDPKEVMISYTTIFGDSKIGFRIMNSADGKLRLIDLSNYEEYIITSVEDGKRKAQELFEKYCTDILHNIYQ